MTPAPHADAKRYEALKREIADLGLIRRGSLVKRYMPCGKPGCRCQGQPPQLHGPYYQWTRKVSGKTVTVRLKSQEAKLMEEWIENGRRLKAILAEMEEIAERIGEPLLQRAREKAGADAGAGGRKRTPTKSPTARKGRKKLPK